MAYLDTSVVYPYYFPESRSAQVAEIIGRQMRPTISNYVSLELASAAARNVRDGAITGQDASTVLSLFESHIQSGAYRLINIHAGHIRHATGLVGSFLYPLKGPDALHLAVAQLDTLTFITADRTLAGVAELLGLECIHIL